CYILFPYTTLFRSNPDSCKYEPWKLFSDNDNQLGSPTRKLPLSDRCSRSSYTGQHHSLLQRSRTYRTSEPQWSHVTPSRRSWRSSGFRCHNVSCAFLG